MKLILVKALSALALLILSLCFGLMIPYLLWKLRIGYRPPTLQDEDEDAASTNTDILLDKSDPSIVLSVSNTQSPGKWGSFKKYLQKRYSKLCSYDLISFINCFCGGLFLGICLLELFPESRTSVTNILDKADIKTDLPVTEFLISLGLLLVMVIEQIVRATCARKPKAKKCHCDPSDLDSGVLSLQQISTTPYQDDDQCRLQVPSSTVHCVNETPDCPSALQEKIPDPITSEATRSLFLIAMLSVHSIFEGLALGLKSTLANVIQLLVAIAVHKSVIAFGLGMRLFETFSGHRIKIAILCVVIFCSATPIGCIVGLFLTPTNHNSISLVPTVLSPTEPSYNVTMNNLAGIPATLYVSAILECLATGTFVYVTFTEVIPSEFSPSCGRGICLEASEVASRNRKLPIKPVIKIVALVAGFSAITGLLFV